MELQDWDKTAVDAAVKRLEGPLREAALEVFPEVVPTGNKNYDAAIGAVFFLLMSSGADHHRALDLVARVALAFHAKNETLLSRGKPS